MNETLPETFVGRRAVLGRRAPSSPPSRRAVVRSRCVRADAAPTDEQRCGCEAQWSPVHDGSLSAVVDPEAGLGVEEVQRRACRRRPRRASPLLDRRARGRSGRPVAACRLRSPSAARSSPTSSASSRVSSVVRRRGVDREVHDRSRSRAPRAARPCRAGARPAGAPRERRVLEVLRPDAERSTVPPDVALQRRRRRERLRAVSRCEPSAQRRARRRRARPSPRAGSSPGCR